MSEPVWKVDLEDDYSASVLRASWGLEINDSFADLGAPWTTYQPAVSGGITPDNAARFTGSWKRFADIAIVRGSWTVTSDDTIDGTDVTVSLPFDVVETGIVRLSGSGTAFDSSGTVERQDFEVRQSGTSVQFVSPNANRTMRGTDFYTTLPASVSYTIQIKLTAAVTATGGTYDNDLASTYTPGAGAPSEAYHSKINVNFALPGTFTTSTAQFLFEGTGGTALTVTSPIRRYAKVGDLLLWQFEWSGPVTGSVATDPWYASIPTGTLADSGDQYHGPAYVVTNGTNANDSMGWVGAEWEDGVSDGTKVGMYLVTSATLSTSWNGVRVSGSSRYTDSSVRFQSGLLVSRLA